uniref:Rhamnogalacturonan lyase domain-containing protein n=1 Tax=Nelumbo nucifera TaxID=4432 RepID=A0A822YJC8_NELNU|nr:TPA_asm: hypothetical protein HUJ06_011531 [Nelumbo nucifera]
MNLGGYADLGTLVNEPPRDALTLWEIGVPDHSAAEFFIPDLDSRYFNPLYINQGRFRQYGLWEKYGLLYPYQDLAYTVGVSDYRKDWYAHITRTISNPTGHKILSGLLLLKWILASVSFSKNLKIQIRHVQG